MRKMSLFYSLKYMRQQLHRMKTYSMFDTHNNVINAHADKCGIITIFHFDIASFVCQQDPK